MSAQVHTATIRNFQPLERILESNGSAFRYQEGSALRRKIEATFQ